MKEFKKIFQEHAHYCVVASHHHNPESIAGRLS